MNGSDQKIEDAVLKRMLDTPPKPHKEKADEKSSHSGDTKRGKVARRAH
jgi:hypothetical protein